MTIAATIGAGGLRVINLASISRSDMSKLIVGALLVSVLAIIAALLLQWLPRTLTPKGLLKCSISRSSPRLSGATAK
ncbi:hypothetical protein RA268_30525, partial [Pseudomonas syringae pv. tagetis]